MKPPLTELAGLRAFENAIVVQPSQQGPCARLARTSASCAAHRTATVITGAADRTVPLSRDGREVDMVIA
jgi:hypothetical protein